MAQKHINTSTPNDNLGDTLRDANIKCEDNFTELYANKVDKISGKGLSTNDYTTAEKTKLAGIPADAEKNVQADWLANDPDSDEFIKNKPNLISSVNWGDIQGDIANQYDLQNALDQKPSFGYVDGKISQTVNANIFDFAPSEDAVYNALTLKEDASDKNNANGYAGLDANGKLFSNQLPALAISETFVVASEAEMLALTGAERGDIAVRTDVNKTFILKNEPFSTLANWQELLTPTDAVTSVFGRVGAVVANAGDYTTALVPDTTNKRYQTDAQAARNDATSSIQTQLDSKALDSNALHKTGNEIFEGVKSATNTGSGMFNGINLTNNSASAPVFQLTNTGNGTGASILNTQGFGLQVENESGYGINLTHNSTARGINVTNTKNGQGIYIANQTGGTGTFIDNIANGVGVKVNNRAGYNNNGIDVTNLGTGTGYNVNNVNDGYAHYISNTSGGTGIYIGNNGSGNGISLRNYGRFGISMLNYNNRTGISLTNYGTGVGYDVSNHSTGYGAYFTNYGAGITHFILNTANGTGMSINSSQGSTGNLLEFQKETNITTKVDSNGIITTPTPASGDNSTRVATTAFVKSNSTQGTGTTNYISKWTATGTTGNSQIFDNGTNVGFGTTTPSTKITVWDNTTGDLISGRVGSLETQAFTLGGYNLDTVNAGFILKTNKGGTMTESFRVDHNGNMGIGTSTPYSAAKFSVKTATNHNLGVIDRADGVLISSYNDAVNTNGIMEHVASSHVFSNGRVLIGLSTDSDDGINKVQVNGSLKTNGLRPITLDTSTGAIKLKASLGGWAMGSFIFGSSDTLVGSFGVYGSSNEASYHYIGSDFANPIATFLENTNVLIGKTTDTGEKLQVEGSLKATTIESTYSISINSTDLNNLTRNGNFDGTGLTNAPSTGYWYIQNNILNQDSGYYRQIATAGASTTYAEGTTFIRVKVGGVWQAWQQLATTANVKPYKVWVGNVSQSLTNAPTATVFENTLGGTLVFSRDDVGQYRMTLAGAFTGGKVFFLHGGSLSAPSTMIRTRNVDANYCTLIVNGGLSGADNTLNSTCIEIRVYP